ncbi:MAG: hypothetical protein WDW36_009545 [Sanguina aurantia]
MPSLGRISLCRAIDKVSRLPGTVSERRATSGATEAANFQRGHGREWVGNLLGAGFPKTARLTSLISILIATAFMGAMGLVILLTRNQLAYLYTDDPEVRYWMSVIAPMAALFQLFDGIQGTSQGVLRGCGRQHQLMFTNLFGFWVCGVLVGALLCFKAGMGLRGLWWGITIGDIVTAVVTFCVFLLVDWEREAKIAQRRQDEQQALEETRKGERSQAEGEDPTGRLLQP